MITKPHDYCKSLIFVDLLFSSSSNFSVFLQDSKFAFFLLKCSYISRSKIVHEKKIKVEIKTLQKKGHLWY